MNRSDTTHNKPQRPAADMTNIVNLHTARKAKLQAKSNGITLCQSGFHKWQAVPGQHFDVKQGKLITTERCTRCNKERTRLT